MNSIDRKASSTSIHPAIDIEKVRQHDMEELLKLAFQLDAKAVTESFARAGVKVQNYNDIALVARLHNTGGDESGALLNRFGNKIIFSVKRTLEGAKSDFEGNFRQKQLNLKWK